MRKKGKLIACVMAALTALSVFTGCPEPSNPPAKTDMTTQERAAVADYIMPAAYDETAQTDFLTDVSNAIAGVNTDGIKSVSAAYSPEGGSATINVELDSYDYDGSEEGNNRKATGTIVLGFNGEGDASSFSAGSYTISAEGLRLEGGAMDMVLAVKDASGWVMDAIEDGSAKDIEFNVSDGKITSISPDSIGSVFLALADSGMVSMDGRNDVAIVEILEDAGDLIPLEPEDITAELLADVNAMVKKAFAAFDSLTSGSKKFATEDYTGTAVLSVDKETEGWILSVMANRNIKADGYDVIFDITSEDVAAGNEIYLLIGGNAYTVAVSDVMKDAVIPEMPFEWDITPRVARHSRGEAEDHGNWELIEMNSTADKITISAPVGLMEKFTSSDPVQAEKGDQAWFAILIGTGEDDITKVSINGTPLDESEVAARNDMLGKDGSDARSDEFVLWMYPENASRTITLSHDGVEDHEIVIEFNTIYTAPDADDVKADLAGFFGEFAKIQGWDKGTHNEALYVDSEDLYGFDGWNQDVTAYLSFGKYDETVETVSMAGKDFSSGDEMQVSIGNNVFYRDKGWYVDGNGELMVNKVFMYASLAFGEDFEINGKAYEYILGLENADELELSYDWKDAPYSSIEDLGNGEYDVVVGATNKPLYSAYESQADDDIILCITDYGMRDGSVTRQLALLTGEKSQFISYFYGWDTTMETIYNAYDRDIVDKSLVFAADGSMKGMYSATYHVTPAYVLDSELTELAGYFMNPAHERIFNRIGGFEDEAFAIKGSSYEDGKLTVTMTADGFEYQKSAASHVISGDITFVFTGTADVDTFCADSWMIVADDLDIDGEHAFATDGFGGKISTDGGLGTVPGTADFGLDSDGWDGTVRNPKEAKFSVALGLDGSALIDGKVLTADRFADLV